MAVSGAKTLIFLPIPKCPGMNSSASIRDFDKVKNPGAANPQTDDRM
jgi:hypothetical protein